MLRDGQWQYLQRVFWSNMIEILLDCRLLKLLSIKKTKHECHICIHVFMDKKSFNNFNKMSHSVSVIYDKAMFCAKIPFFHFCGDLHMTFVLLMGPKVWRRLLFYPQSTKMSLLSRRLKHISQWLFWHLLWPTLTVTVHLVVFHYYIYQKRAVQCYD